MSGTEEFAKLVWRIFTKPGTVVISSGKNRYGPSLEYEQFQLANTYSVVEVDLPSVTKLGASTFLETFG